MIFQSLIAGGFVYAGIHVYRGKSTEQTLVDALSKRPLDSPQIINRSQYDAVRLRFQSILSDNFAPLLGESRQQQINMMASTASENGVADRGIDGVEIDQIGKKNTQNLVISLASLGFASAATLVYAPLRLVSTIGLLYVSFPFFQDGYCSLKQGRVTIGVLDTVIASLCIVSGYQVSWSLACSLNLFRAQDSDKNRRSHSE